MTCHMSYLNGHMTRLCDHMSFLYRYMAALQWVLPLSMIFGWLISVALTTRAIVQEKESRLKEFMKMMGVSDSSLRLSWFITTGTVLSISVVIITVILKAGGLLPYSDGILVFIFLTIYAFVIISYSFLLSVFFNNANLAACVSSLLYFMSFFAHIVLIPKQQYLSPALLVLCVSFCVCVSVFCLYLHLSSCTVHDTLKFADKAANECLHLAHVYHMHSLSLYFSLVCVCVCTYLVSMGSTSIWFRLHLPYPMGVTTERSSLD